ncbi:uncharacterized protein LOC121732314 [Aricia agestis]|uniref:uncharacterized protein LOC121732314 n=1 Tax=Aricia agestis TaxID=91739 RepID=UPI001C209C79|nr:uncharacterized protein LOC121732314 [Aricia agestis]
MSDDEYDDELPPIDVNSSASKDNQYVMPSADVIASQRAYEEVCEQELHKMRSQYECEDVVTICHDSSGSEGEASLAAAVEALKVQNSQATSQLDAGQLLQKFIASASDWDITFLQDYLDVLKNEDASTVRHVTDNIISSIEDVVKQSVRSGNTLNEQELQVVGLWLCAASLWNSPRVASARRCLQVLLGYLTEQQLQQWCDVVGRSLDSAALVQASDVIAAPPPAARAASAALLRAALHGLAPKFNLDKTHIKLSVEEVCESLGSVWRTLTPAQQYTATQVAGRALVDAVDMTETPDNVIVKSEASIDDTVTSEASMDVTVESEASMNVTVKNEIIDIADNSIVSMDVTAKSEIIYLDNSVVLVDNTVSSNLSMDMAEKHEAPMDSSKKGEASINVPTKTKATTKSCAISRLLTLMATQLPQHRYRPDYLRVLMAVSKLQNLFKNYQTSEQRK